MSQTQKPKLSITKVLINIAIGLVISVVVGPGTRIYPGVELDWAGAAQAPTGTP